MLGVMGRRRRSGSSREILPLSAERGGGFSRGGLLILRRQPILVLVPPALSSRPSVCAHARHPSSPARPLPIPRPSSSCAAPVPSPRPCPLVREDHPRSWGGGGLNLRIRKLSKEAGETRGGTTHLPHQQLPPHAWSAMAGGGRRARGWHFPRPTAAS